MAVFDNSATGANGSGAATLSFNMTIGALGGNGLIVVVAEGETVAGGSSNQDITGITFNGVAMTLVASDKNTGSHSCSVAMYELHGANVPAAGTYSVVVSYTNGSNDSQAAVCMSFRGIKPQVKEAAVTTNANGTNDLSLAITTVTSNALVVAGYGNQNSGTTTFTTGESGSFSAVPGSGEISIAFAGYKTVATAGAVTTTVHNGNPETEALLLASFAISSDGLLLSDI